MLNWRNRKVDTFAEAESMEKDELRAKIYSKTDELPTLPTVVPKLMGLMEGLWIHSLAVATAMKELGP